MFLKYRWKSNRTRTKLEPISIAKRTESNEPELFDKPNPNQTELSDWSNWTEPELYAVGSIHISSRKLDPHYVKLSG